MSPRSIASAAVPLLVLVPLLALAPAAHADDSSARRAAAGYLAALVDHDPSGVPLHPEAIRTENGVRTGYSGEQIRRDLEDGPQYRVIQRVRDAHYRQDGDTVTVDYLLDVGAGARLASAPVHETFELQDGLIKTIVAQIGAPTP